MRGYEVVISCKLPLGVVISGRSLEVAVDEVATQVAKGMFFLKEPSYSIGLDINGYVAEQESWRFLLCRIGPSLSDQLVVTFSRDEADWSIHQDETYTGTVYVIHRIMLRVSDPSVNDWINYSCEDVILSLTLFAQALFKELEQVWEKA